MHLTPPVVAVASASEEGEADVHAVAVQVVVAATTWHTARRLSPVLRGAPLAWVQPSRLQARHWLHLHRHRQWKQHRQWKRHRQWQAQGEAWEAVGEAAVVCGGAGVVAASNVAWLLCCHGCHH